MRITPSTNTESRPAVRLQLFSAFFLRAQPHPRGQTFPFFCYAIRLSKTHLRHIVKAISAAIIVLAGAQLTTTHQDVLVLAGMLIGIAGLIAWVILLAAPDQRP
jgi:hypothetical protein